MCVQSDFVWDGEKMAVGYCYLGMCSVFKLYFKVSSHSLPMLISAIGISDSRAGNFRRFIFRLVRT